MFPSDPTTTQTGPPEVPPQKKHHYVRNTVIVAGAAIVAGVAVGVVANAGHKTVFPPSPPPHNYNTPSSLPPTTAAPAAVVPSPDGTFQGSCSYDLGSDPVGGTAVATGDINAVNTGNIGIVTTLTITWPQEGYGPLKSSKTVKIPTGGQQDVQFHMSLTQDQLDRLQNYQLGHSGDGCTYNGTMTDTFGQAK